MQDEQPLREFSPDEMDEIIAGAYPHIRSIAEIVAEKAGIRLTEGQSPKFILLLPSVHGNFALSNMEADDIAAELMAACLDSPGLSD